MFRENDLDPSDVFEYCEYGGGLANETVQVFKTADRLSDLKKSVKLNIHYLVTSNQKDLFLLQGILIDKYKINMYEKARDWTLKLIEMINPKCIICEGVYPAKRIAQYYEANIEWEKEVCQFMVKDGIPVFGYKRLFSRIRNKEALVNRIVGLT